MHNKQLDFCKAHAKISSAANSRPFCLHFCSLSTFLLLFFVFVGYSHGKKPSDTEEGKAQRASDRKNSGKDQKQSKKPELPSADWLIKDAETAINLGQTGKAIAIYRGAVVLRDEDPELVFRLADAYRMAGELAEASQEFRRFLEISKDPKRRKEAREAIAVMAKMPALFVDRDLKREVYSREHGVEAFKRGRAMSRKKRNDMAVRYFEAALMLDPTLVGVLRWLGQIYAATDDKTKAAEYYARYLRTMPAGKNADIVRKRLMEVDEKFMGSLSLTSSYPCEVWINGVPVTGRSTPIKNFRLPDGEYSIVFYNREYHIGHKQRVFVKRTEQETIHFPFGILETKLEPWARVRVDGLDVGLWNTVGIPARDKPYTVRFVSHDGKKRMEKQITIEAEKTVTVDKWK